MPVAVCLFAEQQCLNFFPLPHGQGSLRPAPAMGGRCHPEDPPTRTLRRGIERDKAEHLHPAELPEVVIECERP
jgi:hypothetical protein